jgi:hypothetical protein
MKTITASGMSVYVDNDDYTAVSQLTWCVKSRSDGNGFYVYRYIRQAPRKYIRQLLHHFLMNPEPGVRVDHRNGNGLDNQRSNLRIATQQENSFNQRKRERAISRYKGVTNTGLIHHKYVPSKPWRARIRYNNQLIDLGYFATEDEAAAAYDNAADCLFGDFACLNSIAV